MHTDASTPTEVAASKIDAARAILAGALLELGEGSLTEADDLITKAGGKLLAASAAVAEAKRGGPGWWSRSRGPELRALVDRATGGGS